jgi:hypothetical protein
MDAQAECLTVKKAADLLATQRQALDGELRARGFQRWLIRASARAAPGRRTYPPEQAGQADEAVRLREEVERLRVALDAAQTARQELAGKLAGAEFVERATARRCDRLEQRLDDAYRLALEEAKRHGEALADMAAGHARELGRRDLIVAGLREKVEQQLADPGP